jgi:hypothetical protein
MRSVGFTEFPPITVREAFGAAVPKPTRPFPFTPSTVNAGEDEPSFEIVKELVNVEPISIASRASDEDGELEPIATTPFRFVPPTRNDGLTP